MFWLKRMKSEQELSSWALPYGDLMSLLLSIFVMIAAMSELTPGGRFESVRQGVRKAFGLATSLPGANAAVTPPKPVTFLDRLERAGLRPANGESRQTLQTGGLSWELVAAGDRTVFRLPMEGMIDPAGVPTAGGREIVAQLAGALRGGRNDIEVRCRLTGGGGTAAVPAEAAWSRCRLLADGLAREGLDDRRLTVTVSAATTKDEAIDPASGPPDGGACIEVLVHAGLLEPMNP